MKSVIAATLVLFTVSTSAFAFEVPSMDGLPDGAQQMLQSKTGKRSQRASQGDEGQQGQQSSRSGTKSMMDGAMKGDMSGIQGALSSFGQ